MCEFCTQHGEGKKWYLVMRNYSRELWEQEGRQEYFEKFMADFEERSGKGAAQMDALRQDPSAYPSIRSKAIARQKATHWGQVLPIEDVEQVIDLQDSIVRLPCACRMLTTGRREARYCFGVGVDQSGILGKYPDYSHGLEVLEKEEAKKLIRSFDKQGLLHSVWTYKTPYIGALCNCDQDCMVYRTQLKTGLLESMFRAEYVGLVDWDLCNGCKKCLLQCQFGAIHYSNTLKRPTIETGRCWGCGLCRAVCDKGAITLKPRTDFARLPW